MCLSSLLPPALLCWVLDWYLLMWQIVKEVMTLNGHDVFHWLEVLELYLLDWQSTWKHSYPCYRLIWHLFPLWQCFHAESSEKDSLDLAFTAKLKSLQVMHSRISSFFAWSDANEVRSIHFQELIILEHLHMVRWFLQSGVWWRSLSGWSYP